MELEKQIIKITREKGRSFSQITLDDDYIVKDSKPDVVKVIHAKGHIVLEETKVANQSVWLTGKMEFSVLYRSDDAFNKLEELSGIIPFQEKILLDGVGEFDPVKVCGDMEDLSVGLINSRKLAIRAVVNMEVVAEEYIDSPFASGLAMPEEYEQRVEEQEMLRLLTAKRDVLRIRNEIKLPNAKPNIYRVLWYTVDTRNLENSCANGRVHIQGEAYVGVLYLSQGEEQIQWMETMLPVSGEVDCEEVVNPDVCWVKLRPETVEVEARSDYDGEARVLGVDLAFEVELKLWKEEMVPILTDIYALNRNVQPKTEQEIMPHFLMKNVAKIRIGEQMKLEKNQEKILQICACTGDIGIDQRTVTENGVLFEGVLRVHLLYYTADDNLPIARLEAVLPFEQLVEIAGITPDTCYDYEAGVDMLQVNLLDNAEYEIKANLRISVLAFEERMCNKIVDIEESPLDMEELMESPGMVGYIVQPDEDLWDIAKRYHTTMEDIAATNDIKSRKPKAGSKIIIVKKIAAC